MVRLACGSSPGHRWIGRIFGEHLSPTVSPAADEAVVRCPTRSPRALMHEWADLASLVRRAPRLLSEFDGLHWIYHSKMQFPGGLSAGFVTTRQRSPPNGRAS
jgi:hypothetical protein